LTSRSGVTSAASAGRLTAKALHKSVALRIARTCWRIALPPLSPLPFQSFFGATSALRQIDAAGVPVQRVDAHHFLGAVEQRRDLAAAGLVGEFRDAVAHRHGGVAHDVEALIDLEDLIEARSGRGEELHLVAGLSRGGALVLQAHLHALAARGR